MIDLTLIAFAIFFIHATTWEGMINEWVHRATWDWPDFIKKPLFDCPICMGPFWGSIILLLKGLSGAGWLGPFQWILIVFAAGGINAVLINMVSEDKESIKEMKEDEGSCNTKGD